MTFQEWLQTEQGRESVTALRAELATLAARVKELQGYIDINIAGTTAESIADALRIPVLAQIDPQPDPVYGHTFPWPAEVEQFFALNSHA